MTEQVSTNQECEIIPPHLAIKSMRDSGYKDTAHAVAELVDNSIQAGQEIDECTEVEIICLDHIEFVSERRSQRIDKIAVYDNACGMDAEVLRIALQFGNGTHLDASNQDGIGKFGMGLPNSSISQCRKVDVWSWQNSKCLHTYLDVDDMLSGRLRNVPEPEESEIPKIWETLIRDDIGKHGTLVVWSKIDRVRWITSRAFLNNAEFLVGRIYRYFLSEGKARIRLAAFEVSGSTPTCCEERDVKPNDPLYMMEEAQELEPYGKMPAFDLLTQYPLRITVNGQEHEILLRFSVSKKEARRCLGSSALGKHTAKNIGVSVVRAKREIEMNHTFELSYETRERWWGAEVVFGPELDSIMGVTNNKQAATAFYACDLDEDAKSEGLTPGEYSERLEESHDPRLAIYHISREIISRLKTLRDQIKRMAAPIEGEEGGPVPGSVEDIATRATKRRREELGAKAKGKSDDDESKSTSEREKDIEEELVSEGVDQDEAKGIAVTCVTKNYKYLFQEASVPGSAIFDLRCKGGTIIILINTRHPASKGLFEMLREESEDKGSESPALSALKLLITAWARLEDEAGEARRQALEDIRMDWGRIARDFLQEAEE